MEGIKNLWAGFLTRAFGPNWKAFWAIVVGGVTIYGPDIWENVLGGDPASPVLKRIVHAAGLLTVILGGVQSARLGRSLDSSELGAERTVQSQPGMRGFVRIQVMCCMTLALAMAASCASGCATLRPERKVVAMAAGHYDRSVVPDAALTAECASLESKETLYGALEIASGVLGGGTILTEIFPEDRGVRAGVAIAGGVGLAAAAFFHALTNGVITAYNRDCTVQVTAAH